MTTQKTPGGKPSYRPTMEERHSLGEQLASKTEAYERLRDKHRDLLKEYQKLKGCSEETFKPPFEEIVKGISEGTVELIRLPSSVYERYLTDVRNIHNLIWGIIDQVAEEEHIAARERKKEEEG